MSKYTTEVRFICENYAGLTESEGQSNVNKIIAESRDKVFDFDFPIYDESYRSVLETKILKHYYTREIGCETVGLWKHFLDMKMNEIMPYYNQLYESATLDFNPLYDCDYSTTSSRDIGHDEKTTNASKEDYSNSGTRTDNLTEQEKINSTRTDNLAHHDTTVSSSSSKDKYSDTPQGALTNVENETYLTNARIIDENGNVTNDGTNTGTQSNDSDRNRTNSGTQKTDTNGNRNENKNGTRNFNSTDEYIEHVAGKRGSASYSKLLTEYRDTFLNIDLMVIDELSGLFMNLW